MAKPRPRFASSRKTRGLTELAEMIGGTLSVTETTKAQVRELLHNCPARRANVVGPAHRQRADSQRRKDSPPAKPRLKTTTAQTAALALIARTQRPAPPAGSQAWAGSPPASPPDPRTRSSSILPPSASFRGEARTRGPAAHASAARSAWSAAAHRQTAPATCTGTQPSRTTKKIPLCSRSE